ncbi:hypothetical protein K402DRAFT_393329 [Aulographum hederae CBS 113979]|uniref:PHD-type domain-containing protein n=1 Tax=Aulographum hederae CBS 113979 TaxID=1176131 RepID=A0A6G1H159_9PEZI|nr:hypothetical protein K402DRAFT_393329 [Aulographum hederae CBS 113979]
MSFKISSLLNAAEDAPPTTSTPPVESETPVESMSNPSSSRHASYSSYAPVASHGAAEHLSALATAAQYSTPYADQQPPNTVETARRESYGQTAPVEPSPPADHPPSPSLEHYHQSSGSPDGQRRLSALSRLSPSTKLPPIANDSFSAHRDVSRDTGNQEGNQFGGVSQSTEETEFRRDSIAPAQPSLDSTSTVPPPSTHSPIPAIKPEPFATPREGTPSITTTAAQPDAHTLKAVANLKNEHGLRGQSREPTQPQEDNKSTMSSGSPAPVSNTKKRPAPRATGATKKGIAKKSAPKKRKLNNDDVLSRRDGSVPFKATMKSTSQTPMASSPNAANGAASSVHSASSPAAAYLDEDVEMEEDEEPDGNLYCICRKPDNHSWMIACDGGCDDWFHGRCVDMREEDGNLIDKYICPNCEKKGKGVTTWLPMCRREGCRKPARLKKAAPSKYCSGDCGRRFFAELVPFQEPIANGRKKASSERDGEDDIGARGGILRPKEVRALAVAANDISEFRRIGDGVLSPPATASPEQTTFNLDTDKADPATCGFSSSENARLQEINAERDAHRARHALLKDREKFISMVKEQIAKLAEREGVKPKEICGYDGRLAWSDHLFGEWRTSPAGKKALETGLLELPPPKDGPKEQEKMDGVELENGDSPPDDEFTLCTRKRCNRHTSWQKLALHDVKFEESIVAEAMVKLESEERELRERAVLRWRAAKGGTVEGREEGSVQIV